MLLEFFLHDFTWSLGSYNHPLFICVHTVFFLYMFSLFSYFIRYFYILSRKNMKTNMAPLSSVRFWSVFIPRRQYIFRDTLLRVFFRSVAENHF
jgi:hypothetical protein